MEGGGREKVGKMSDCNGQPKPRFEGPIFVSGDCIGHFETCIVSLSSNFLKLFLSLHNKIFLCVEPIVSLCSIFFEKSVSRCRFNRIHFRISLLTSA